MKVGLLQGEMLPTFLFSIFLNDIEMHLGDSRPTTAVPNVIYR